MGTNASIAISVQDNLSQAIVGMRNAVTPFRHDLDALQTELNSLNTSRYSMKIDLDRAKNELKATQRAFEALGASATEAERQAARANFDQAVQNYENVRGQMDMLSRQARQTERDMLNTSGAISRADNRAERAGGGAAAPGMLASLGKAGLIQMGGDVAAQWANIMVGSSMGQTAGTMFSGALSGATSGAALGSLAGLPGMAIGGLAGGIIGTAGAAGQVYEQKNEAFKAYVQEQTQAQMNSMYEDISSGSGIAAKREGDAISFNTLLGQGRGDQYLTDVRAMAANTPMEYDDLTGMSRALATGFKDDTQRMLALMTGIGNAGSAVGIDVDGMKEMAKAMSNMQSSGKANLEYLQIFQERGVDVIGMLGSHLGKTKEQIYDLISKGKIGGLDAVNAIQEGMDQMYAGAMEKQGQTFLGLSSTLADAQNEMKAAYGNGYNDTRKQGLQDEIDYLSGISATKQQEANSAMGAFVASLDNKKEEMIRKALDAVLETDDYKSAMTSGTDEGIAEAGRLLMEAKTNAMAEYNATSGAQLMVQMEIQLAGAIRENAESNKAYWDAGYTKGQEYSKGFSAGAGGGGAPSRLEMEGGIPLPTTNPKPKKADGSAPPSFLSGLGEILNSSNNRYGPKAFGMRRVPYNGFRALLHEGERVLTASESRNYNSNEGSTGVTIGGNNFYIREEADIDRIANALADKVELARMGGGG